MKYLLHLIRLLGIVLWVGGLAFFAFIEAPTAFHIMGTNRQFALLIGGSIGRANQLGLICGILFLAASVLLRNRSAGRIRKVLLIESILVAIMLAATAYVQLHIVPAMERDRAAVGGDITSVANTNPVRADFDRLHNSSEQVEGAAVFLGLFTIIAMAAEPRAEIAIR